MGHNNGIGHNLRMVLFMKVVRGEVFSITVEGKTIATKTRFLLVRLFVGMGHNNGIGHNLRMVLFMKVVRGEVMVPAEHILQINRSQTRAGAKDSYKQIRSNTETYRQSFFPMSLNIRTGIICLVSALRPYQCQHWSKAWANCFNHSRMPTTPWK